MISSVPETLALTSKTVPAPSWPFPLITVAEWTSLCQFGSLRTSATYAKTSSAGLAMNVLLSQLIMSLSSRFSVASSGCRSGEAGQVLAHHVGVRVVLTDDVDDRRTRSAIEVSTHRLAQVVVERGLDMLGDQLHVELHRLGVAVDLHDRHRPGRLVGEEVEGNQAWLVRLDELGVLRQLLPGVLETTLANLVGTRVDEFCGHCSSLPLCQWPSATS